MSSFWNVLGVAAGAVLLSQATALAEPVLLVNDTFPHINQGGTIGDDAGNDWDIPWVAAGPGTGLYSGQLAYSRNGAIDWNDYLLQVRPYNSVFPGVGKLYDASGAVPASISLSTGQSVRLSFNFIIYNNLGNGATDLRFGLYSGGGDTFQDDDGYAATLGTGTSQAARIYEEAGAPGMIIVGDDFVQLPGNSVAPTLQTLDKKYSAVFEVARTASSTVQISLSVLDGATEIGSVSSVDTVDVYTSFNQIVFGAMSARLQVDNVKLESVPEPASMAALGLISLTLLRRARPRR